MHAVNVGLIGTLLLADTLEEGFELNIILEIKRTAFQESKIRLKVIVTAPVMILTIIFTDVAGLQGFGFRREGRFEYEVF